MQNVYNIQHRDNWGGKINKKPSILYGCEEIWTNSTTFKQLRFG